MEKKGKAAKNAQRARRNDIPLNRPVKVGSYKVWRSKKEIGKGKDKVQIDQINISLLDESWQVKIPATFDMYGIISELFAQARATSDKKEVSMLDKRAGQLTTIFGNMLYASCVANGYFQQALQMCASIYANPSVLKEEDESHERVIDDAKALAKGFLAWFDSYGEHVASNEPTEEEMQEEQVADEMLDELGQPEETTEDNGDRT